MGKSAIWLFLLVVAVGFSYGEAGECNDGETKYDSCNICHCQNQNWLCIPSTICLNKRAVDNPQTECQNGDEKMLDCNRCWCTNGIWACTKIGCHSHGPLPENKLSVARSKREVQCNDGDTKMNDCNRCWCTNGIWACTLIGCLHGPLPENKLSVARSKRESKCKDGDTKMNDCNRCWCTNGIWACTLMGCFHGTLPGAEERTKTEAQPCKDGDSKMLDCNRCWCTNGNWACTLMGCFHGTLPGPVERTKRGAECKQGDTKKDDCNHCFCANGIWACTLMECIHNDVVPGPKKLERSKREETLAADLKNTPCAPNDYFQIDCNTCYCNMERSGYLCTENICHDGFFESSTTTQIPLSKDSMLIISDHGVQLVENANSNDNNLSRIPKNLNAPVQAPKSFISLAQARRSGILAPKSNNTTDN